MLLGSLFSSKQCKCVVDLKSHVILCVIAVGTCGLGWTHSAMPLSAGIGFSVFQSKLAVNCCLR